jgi:hypothetical protein
METLARDHEQDQQQVTEEQAGPYPIEQLQVIVVALSGCGCILIALNFREKMMSLDRSLEWPRRT